MPPKNLFLWTVLFSVLFSTELRGDEKYVASWVERCVKRNPYQIVKTVSSPGLGKRFLVEHKKGKAGWPMHEFVGSPKIPIETFGPEFAKFLGFEVVNESQMYIPSPNYLNARIKQYNDSVTDPDLKIFAKFYEPGVARVAPVEYNERILRGQVAMATEGIEFFHDVSFHIPGAILLPERIFAAAERQYRTVVDFEKFLKQKHPEALQMRGNVRKEATITVGDELAREIEERREALEKISANAGMFVHPNFPRNFNLGRNTQNIIERTGRPPADALMLSPYPDAVDFARTPEYLALKDEFLKGYKPSWNPRQGLNLTQGQLEALLKRRRDSFEQFGKDFSLQ